MRQVLRGQGLLHDDLGIRRVADVMAGGGGQRGHTCHGWGGKRKRRGAYLSWMGGGRGGSGGGHTCHGCCNLWLGGGEGRGVRGGGRGSPSDMARQGRGGIHHGGMRDWEGAREGRHEIHGGERGEEEWGPYMAWLGG